MAAKIDICNDALNELAAPPIGSIGENSLQGKQCAAHFDGVAREILEAHDWSFQIVRMPLAAVTLDRVGEWLYAYAAPSDIAKTLSLLRVYTVDPSVLVYPGEAQRPALPFLISGTTLYANITPAWFSYVSRNINFTGMSQRCARAIALEMAVRMAMPLKKSREIKGDLIKQAQVALERAIADDMNSRPMETPDYVTDVEIVRNGYGGALWQGGA